MNAVYKLIWNISTGTWAVAQEGSSGHGKKNASRRASRVMQHAAAALLLTGGAAGSASADVNNGGLQLCNPGQDYGTSIGVTWGQTSPVACRGAYYSFWLGNGVNGTGSGTNDTTAAVWGNAAGQLHMLGKGGVFLDGNSTFGGTANLNNNKITNLAAGTADTDAVNLRQLNRAISNVGSDYVKVGSGQAGTPADNVGRAGNIAIGGNARSNAPALNSASIALGEDALSNGAGSVAVGTGSIATGSGAVALGLRSAATAAGAVAIGFDSLADRANAVSIGKTGQLRQLTHLAAGTDDTDAANMAQLKKNAATTASALGGAAAMAADGSVVAPRYVLDGGTYNNVGDALGNLDGRVSTNRQSIIDLGKAVEDLSQGDFGLVSYDDVRGSVDVAAGKGGSQVDVRGTDGVRRLAGVANATNDDEAVTLAQLRAAGALDPTSGTFLSVLTYDDAGLGKATLGGTGGTVIDNLRNGQVAAGSMQAINGGQLFQSLTDAASILGGGAGVGLQGAFVAPNYVIQGTTYNNVGSALAALDGKVSDIDQRLTGQGAIRMASVGGNATVAGGVASQAQAKTYVGTPAAATTAATTGTAVGAGAVASGVAATAIGEGAVASADNAVALGQGSIADRAGTVSVGSVGNERQIANVADGTEATDAVNKAQLDRGVASANTYTDTRFQGLSDSFDVFKGEVDQRLRGMDRRIDRQGAMSSAMLNMATSAAGVRTDNRVGVGVGFQGGQSALSVGYQRAISERATVTLGGALSGDDASVGFGAGFGW